MSSPGGREGLLASLQRFASALLGMVQLRLELLGNEVEVEKLRILRMLLLALASLCSAVLALLLLMGLVTLWLWDLRLGVLGAFSALFALGSWLTWRALMRQVKQGESPFSASLGELREDLRRLRRSAGHAATPD